MNQNLLKSNLLFKFFFLLLFFTSNINLAQVKLSADGPGNTYELINSVLANPGQDVIEVPDCSHTEFGRHIDEIFDNDLDKYVFRFHIHVEPDNDRCINFDRQRNEIKTYSGSPENLLARIGENVTYTWRFKIPLDFKSSPNFTHVHQIKSVGDAVTNTPMYTITLRKGTPDQIELRHATNGSQVTLAKTDLTPFKGTWLEVTETISFDYNSSFSIDIKRVSDNVSLFSHTTSSIDNWQDGADFARPKWGIYRSLLNQQDLQDEEVLFSDFSITEFSSLPVYESFDYTVGENLIEDNATLGLGPWSTTGPRTGSDIVVANSPNWSLPNIQTPQGNAIQFKGSGVKPELLFTPQTGNFGAIYASALIKVTDASDIDTAASRFLAFANQSSNSSISGASSVFIKSDGNGGFNLGVNESSSTTGITWDTTSYTENQELMIVLYFNDAQSSSASAKLWINPIIDGIEPSAKIQDTGIRDQDVDRIQIYQHSNANTPKIILDELRIGKSWTSVTNTPNKKIILKLDDVAVKNSSSNGLPTVQYLVNRGIKASYGFVATRNDETTLSILSSYLNSKNSNGERLIEIWNHGYDHIRPEFDGTGYAYQKQHFEEANDSLNKLFRVEMKTFGAPFNGTDEDTNTVVSENPAYKVTFFQNPAPNPVTTGLLNLTNRVNIEITTGNVDFDFFMTDYNDHRDDYTDSMILQGHPNAWDTNDLNEFERIIDFLIAEGWEFELPYQYYLAQNPDIQLPSTNQTITFPDIADKTIGDPDFNPGATSTSNLQVLYNSSNHDVAEIVNGNIRLKGIGTAIITASQLGDATYKKADYVSKTLTVSNLPSQPLIAELPAYEGFNYSIGNKLIENNAAVGLGNWSTIAPNTTSDAVIVASPTWTINGINSPTGNALQFEGSGVNPEFLFTAQEGNFGTIYASALIKVTSIASLDTSAGRIFGFGRQNSGGTFSGSTFAFIRLDASGSGFNLGVNETNSTSGITWDNTVFNQNQELMIVIYFDDSNTGSTAKMWINPIIGSIELLPTLVDANPRNSNVDRIKIYQDGSADTPRIILDELRVGKTWTSVTEISNIWNGNSVNWSEANNWSEGVVPSNEDNVIIPLSTANNPVINSTTGVFINNLIVAAGASLTIDSGGSLYVDGIAVGEINYSLNITDDKWHLISSPVIDEYYDNIWVNSNSIASGSATSSNRGIASYNNTQYDPITEYWRYMQENDVLAFNSGQGYSIKKVDKTDPSFKNNLVFSGSYNNTDLSFTITKSASRWNLIGNPYSSYISVESFLSSNSGSIYAPFLSIYVWNSELDRFDNLNTGYLHPGQAFFVNSASNSTTIDFTKNMQSHQSGVTLFKSSDEIPKIRIALNINKEEKFTDLTFIKGKTNGLDPGYDIGLFDGVSTNFKIFTHLLEENENISFKQQALPDFAINNVTVPIGISAKKDSEIKFISQNFNIPSDVKIYLEDKEKKTFTDLSETNSEHIVTLSENLNGVGRFYLRTTRETLDLNDIETSNIRLYQSSNELKIYGLDNSNFKLSVYSVIGGEILSENFISNEPIKSVKLSSFTSGVYIVKLESENILLNKKIVID